jgi:2'-5' RNA ligase
METAIIVALPRCDLLVSAVAAELEIHRPPGMPAHVTLLYPFVDESTLVAGMAAQAQRALSHIAPFECEFASFGRFIDPIPTALHLVPNPADPFRGMIAALERTFALRAYGGQFGEVIPHVTLVESPDPALWARTESRVGESLPLSETISTFSIYRETHSGWHEAFTMPLGRSPDVGLPSGG